MADIATILTNVVTLISLLSMVYALYISYRKTKQEDKDDLRKDYERVKAERDEYLLRVEALGKRVDELEKEITYLKSLILGDGAKLAKDK